MRKLIASEFITLDGVVETPERWVFPYITEEINQVKLHEMKEISSLILGNTTYEIFANSWPARTGPLADCMNGISKYVACPSKQKLTWANSEALPTDQMTAIAELKQQPGKDMLLVGSISLAQSLASEQLIDEYRLFVAPLVIGSGRHLWTEETASMLALIDAKIFSSGMVLLRYRTTATMQEKGK